MMKALIVLIYNAINDDYMIDSERQNLDWPKIDIVKNPTNEQGKSTIYIKGDNGGKDYKITVEEV